jgi:hypothetical protein
MTPVWNINYRETDMVKLAPFNQQDSEQWRRQNEETLQTVQDDGLKGIISGILNLHELEHTGAWKHSGRRLDYANSTFEVYLHHHTTWSLNDFRLLEEVVFEHFDELKRKGLESVLMRLKRLKNEPDPLAERRRNRRK